MEARFISQEELENVFFNEYYKLPRRFLTYTGLWPFQRKFERFSRQAIVYLVMLSTLQPLAKGIMVSFQDNDLQKLSENILGFLLSFSLTVKYFASAAATKNLKIVYSQFARNWLSIKNPNECTILKKFAAQGKSMGIVYLGYFICCFIGFSFTPMIPALLDIILPLNQTRPKILVFNTEYPVDPNENYLVVFLMLEMYVVVYFVVIVGIDTMFMAIIHHFLGIFSIIKYRLLQSTINLDPVFDGSYDQIIQAINLHQDSLNFIDIIRATYYNAFIAYIGMTTLFVSVGAVIIANQVKILTLFEIFKFLSLTLGMIIHGLYVSWCGQQITDYSGNLSWEAYNNEWYNIPKRSKTLLHIMMLRCKKPCSLSAGGLTEINLYNFGVVLKTAVSYMTVIASFNSDEPVDK